MKSSYTVPLAIIFGGSVIAVAVYVSMPKRPATNESVGNPALVRPLDTTDHILGNPAAKVVIIEYSDFDCEYCKGFNDTLHQIIANAGVSGNVAWVFREFPLTELHPNALKHAEAAECAEVVAGNDAFWKFADMLFANQPVDPAQYGTYAKSLGIDGDAFATCYADAVKNVDARILADRKNALDLGAEGAPYSLILVTGQPPVVMNGAYPPEAVKLLIEQAVQSAN
jgi:protein-disulfide isomerase